LVGQSASPVPPLRLSLTVRRLPLTKPGRKSMSNEMNSSVHIYKPKRGTRFFEWLYIRARKKGASIEKYESLGLYVFVAIPLPGTGAWTGALVASVLGMRFLPALIAIGLGVATAGVIVTALSVLGWWGAIIAGVIIMAAVVWNYIRK
ncbi:MAG: small multi-drug export protein, partial [candidate division WOR-3 bacterium]